MFSISKQTASARMTRKGFGGRNDPKVLGMGSHQQLTGPCIREFISLELASDMHGILSSEINGVCISASIGTLNYDSL
jgi:hypothetical protein